MGTKKVERRIYRDVREMSHNAAERISTILNEALQAGRRASFVFAGGNTPKLLYEILASATYEDSVSWKNIDYFWSDERYVPHDHDQSNYRMVRECFLDEYGIDGSRIYGMPTEDQDPLKSAQSYEQTLRSYFGQSAPSFDILLLGMGTDGHVASLFPHSPSLYSEQWVAVTEAPHPPHTRLSLTFPLINAARNIFVLVSGKEKSATVRSVLKGSVPTEEIPASMISPQHNLFWYLDRDSASELRI